MRDGYEFNGQRYRSLSRIAREIITHPCCPCIAAVMP